MPAAARDEPAKKLNAVSPAPAGNLTQPSSMNKYMKGIGGTVLIIVLTLVVIKMIKPSLPVTLASYLP